MLSAARVGGWSALLVSCCALAQDLGLDLTGDTDTGAPRIAVTVPKDLTGAVLYVDDVEIGTLPLDPVPVNKGKHTVTVQRPGYADFNTTVQLKQGTTNVSATLVATGEAVHLTSDPDGADIVVDGKGHGKTPQVLGLAPGKHELRLVKDGYVDWTYTLFTRAGRDTDLNGELKPMGQPSDKPLATNLEPEQMDPDLALRARARNPNPAWYTRWYVWAGAAVVVAAVVTGVAVAASHHSTPGLDPNTVCQGPCDIVLNSP
jgi:hypothetical protein